MKILAHAPFIGATGYANHARSFFCALNKYHTVKVRNFTIGESWNEMSETPHNNEPYITEEMKDMLILQTLKTPQGREDFPIYGYKGDFKPDINIVLQEMDHTYFYDNYKEHTIAYNVYESTRYPEHFFNKINKFNEIWVPTQWQRDSIIEQGANPDKVKIIPEGVDVDTFKPIEIPPKKDGDKFKFLLFGRWDYRKSTTEVIKTFGETFKNNPNVELIASVENPYPYDETRSTKDRIKKHKVNYPNITYLKFPPREDYIKYLQEGDVFLSCARSEGWNLPLIEAMSCGTPSIYSNWGGQLQFAKNKGIPVKISHIRSANIGNLEVGGEYCEPDFDDLKTQMLDTYENFKKHRLKALKESKLIHKEFNWDNVAKIACNILEEKKSLDDIEDVEYVQKNLTKSLQIPLETPFAFVTTGNIGYMPVMEKLVKSLNEFSKHKIIVYGVDCDVPFDYPNLIKRRIDPPKRSEHDKWYWKQYACIESLNEDFNNFVWLDGDIVVNHNIDDIKKYFSMLENYPIPDIHIQNEFFAGYKDNDENKTQLFNENLSKLWKVEKTRPYKHICMYLYNEKSKWWFEEIIKTYNDIDLEQYSKYFPWNDEGIDNALRWKYGFTNHLPISNFDTSSYDGDDGFTDITLKQFYNFWNEEGPQNFNRVYGFQQIPKDKSTILYFHGNKDGNVSDKMIDFIKLKRDGNFHQTMNFYVEPYKIEDMGDIFGIKGSSLAIAEKYSWQHCVFHEIYNLQDYYLRREKKIFDGDIVVDVGANMGVFTRWAYTEGAKKVISFEPDKRYYKLLKLNANPQSILFNAAISDNVGEIMFRESSHFGGSNVFWTPDNTEGYNVRTYTLDYLFETGLVDRIDFLKVDIEGAEILAFKGISDENLMKVRNIGMEYHNSHLDYKEELRDNLIKRLTDLGFNSYLLYLGTNNALQMLYFTR